MDQPKPKFEAAPVRPEVAAEAGEHPAAFESPKAPETALEAPVSAPAPARVLPAVPASPAKDEETREVEAILEEGLGETYRQLSPADAAKFKREGERVTHEIVGMLKRLHVKAGKVLSLIVGWLKGIPGVNRFFLMQEAKIKTDKIVALAEEEKRRRAAGP